MNLSTAFRLPVSFSVRFFARILQVLNSRHQRGAAITTNVIPKY
jgi:hypothetical protein